MLLGNLVFISRVPLQFSIQTLFESDKANKQSIKKYIGILAALDTRNQ